MFHKILCMFYSKSLHFNAVVSRTAEYTIYMLSNLAGSYRYVRKLRNSNWVPFKAGIHTEACRSSFSTGLPEAKLCFSQSLASGDIVEVTFSGFRVIHVQTFIKPRSLSAIFPRAMNTLAV